MELRRATGSVPAARPANLMHVPRMRGELGRTLHEVETFFYETCLRQWKNQAGYRPDAARVMEEVMTPFRAIVRLGLLNEEWQQ